MTTATQEGRTSVQRNIEPGVAIPLDVLAAPGAYVCNWSGHLLRVSDEAFLGGHSPVLNMVGTEPLTVTKISDDPDVLLSTAKRLAVRLNVQANF